MSPKQKGIDRVGLRRRAKFNESCLWKVYFEPNGRRFFGKTSHVATVPLEQLRTVNSEWCTTVCLPEVFGVSKNEQEMKEHCEP